MKKYIVGFLLSLLFIPVAFASEPYAGQFMVLPFRGTEAPLDMLQRYRPAGVILFSRNLQGDPYALVQALRAADPNLLIFIDQEGGPFMSYRTPDVVRFPSAMALGATEDPALIEAAGEAIGTQLCTLGVHANLAPVVDLNTNPDNPIIGIRSFGSHPRQATPLALAFARGLQNAGILPTIKHFPGHGDTDTDSHLGLPVINKSLSELEQIELYPFQQAIDAGIPLVMSAHILYPALDPEHPATLSHPIMTGLLREQMGFDGVIITDDMLMRAVNDRYGSAESARRAVLAGVDLVLVGQDPAAAERTFNGLTEALRSGAITHDRVAETVSRVEALRAMRAQSCPNVDRAAIEDLALEVAKRSVTHLDGPLHIPGPGTLVIAPQISDRYGLEPSLAHLAPEYLPGSESLTLSERPNAEEIVRASARAAEVERIVLGTYHWLGLLPAEQVLLYSTLKASGKPVYVVALGNPDDYTYLNPSPDGYLVTYGYREAQLRAALEILAGTTEPTGRLPMPVGNFPAGAGGAGRMP